MDVQWTGSKGLDGVASVCGNPALRWAKMSMLGIGVESVIILFGDNINLCTSVNLAGKGYHVCIMGVCCDSYFGHDFVAVCLRSLRYWSCLGFLVFPGRLCHSLSIHLLHHQVVLSLGSSHLTLF